MDVARDAAGEQSMREAEPVDAPTVAPADGLLLLAADPFRSVVIEKFDNDRPSLANVPVRTFAANAATLRGDGDNDRIRGGSGDDLIYLGDDRDLALAGNGDDLVDGGAGRDFANGGRGVDTAVDVELKIFFEG